jgi:hypothetical protein
MPSVIAWWGRCGLAYLFTQRERVVESHATRKHLRGRCLCHLIHLDCCCVILQSQKLLKQQTSICLSPQSVLNSSRSCLHGQTKQKKKKKTRSCLFVDHPWREPAGVLANAGQHQHQPVWFVGERSSSALLLLLLKLLTNHMNALLGKARRGE